MPQYLKLPNGSLFPINEGESKQDATLAALEKYPEAFGLEPTQPKATAQPGFGAAFRSGVEALKGDIGAIGAGLGVEGSEEYARAQREKAAQAYQLPEFSEAPIEYIKGLAGQSLPYMAAPLAAGLAATGLGPLAAAGAAGAASLTQFTGSNVSRQLEEGKTGEQIEMGKAALAAVPQAALDVVSFKAAPLIRNIFKAAGKEITEEAATNIAKQGVMKTVQDYGAATGKAMTVEGLTEAGQQLLERAQAGLNLTDESARDEYWDSLFGGAVLGGVLAVPGRAVERSGEKRREATAQRLQQDQADLEAQQAVTGAEVTPEYAADVVQRYEALVAQEGELQEKLRRKVDKTDLAGLEDKREAAQKLKELRQDPERETLVAEYRKLRATGALGGMGPVRPMAAPTTAEELEGFEAPKAGTYSMLPTTPVVDEEAKAAEQTRILERVRQLQALSRRAQEAVPEAGARGDAAAVNSLSNELALIDKELKELRKQATKAGIDQNLIDVKEQIQTSRASLEAMLADARAKLQEIANDPKGSNKKILAQAKEIEQIEQKLAQATQQEATAQTDLFGAETPMLDIQERREEDRALLGEQMGEGRERVAKTREEIDALNRIAQANKETAPDDAVQAALLEAGFSPTQPPVSSEGYYASGLLGATSQTLQGQKPGEGLLYTTEPEDRSQARRIPAAETGQVQLFAQAAGAEPRAPTKQVLEQRLASLLAADIDPDTYNFLRRMEAMLPEADQQVDGVSMYQALNESLNRVEADLRLRPEGEAVQYGLQPEERRSGIASATIDPDEAQYFERKPNLSAAQIKAYVRSMAAKRGMDPDQYERDLRARSTSITRRTSLERAGKRPLLTLKKEQVPLIDERLVDFVNTRTEGERVAATEVERQGELFTQEGVAKTRAAFLAKQRAAKAKKQPEPELTPTAKAARERSVKETQERREKAQASIEKAKATQRALEAKFGESDKVEKRAFEKISEAERLARSRGESLVSTTDEQVAEKDPLKTLAGLERKEKALRRRIAKGIERSRSFLMQNTEKLLNSYTRLNEAYWKNPTKEGVNKVEQARKAYDEAVERVKYQENIMWVGAGRDVTELQSTMARIEDLREGIESGRYVTVEQREAAVEAKPARVERKTETLKAEAQRGKETLKAVQAKGPVPTTSGEALTRSQVAKAKAPAKTVYSSKGVSTAKDENTERILEKLQKTRKITMADANKVPFEMLPKQIQNQLLVSRAAARDAKKAAAVAGEGRAIDPGDVEYSLGTVNEGLTAADVSTELDQAMGEKDVVKGSNGKVRVYNTVADFVAENPEYAGKIRPDARAFVQDGKAVLFGENIGKGEALSVLLHEIGAHVGMRGTMPNAQYNALVQTVKGWAKRTDNSLEARIGRAAMQRVEAAQTPAAQANDELLAYAIEEAVLAGVNPDGVNQTVAQRFVRMVVNAFNKVLRTFGLKGKDVNAVELINMAYGAAQLELKQPAAPVDIQKDEILFSVKPSTGSSIVGQEPSTLSKIRQNVFGLAGRMQFVDSLAALEETIRRGLGAMKLSDAEATQTNYNIRIMGMANNFVGQVATNGPVRRIKTKEGDYVYRSEKGANLRTIAQHLQGAKDAFPDTEVAFTVMLAGERAKKVGWEKLNPKKPAAARAEYENTMRTLEANPKAKAAFTAAEKAWREVNDGVLDSLVATGEMTPELAKQLKAQRYVPYFRMNGDEVQLFSENEKPVTIGNIKDQPLLRELIGDDATIQPFFTSAMRSIAILTRMGMRNATIKDTAYTLKKLGMASAIRSGPKPAGTEYVAFKEHGQPKYVKIDQDAFGIPAELVVKGLEGIKTTLPAVVRALGAPADLLRYTVTRMPTYALRQIIRDPMSMFLTGNMNSTPVISSMKQLLKMQGGKSPTEQQLMQSGVINSNIFTGDTRDLDVFMREVVKGGSGWTKALSRLDALAMQGDAASRAVLWEESKKQGFSDIEADLRVLESMNFSRRGLSPSMMALNTMIPFFNAQVQGLDVLYRSMTGKMPYAERLGMQKKMLYRGALLALSSIIYAALMQDDEAYQKATPEERAMYWFVNVPGTDKPLRVPIPFEVGYMFKALPELLWNTVAEDTTTKQAAQALGAFIKNATPSVIPQGAKPLIEVALNRSFFTGLDVESKGERLLTSEERIRQDTTELAKILGQTGLVSPIQLDYLLKSYTGGMGAFFASVANPVLRPFSSADMPEGPATDWTDSVLVKSMFQPKDGRGLLNAAFDIVEEAQQASGTYKQMLKEGRRADAQAFLQENLDAIQAASLAGKFRQQMGEWAALKKTITASPRLTPEEKRDQIKRITDLQNRYAKVLIDSQR